MSDTSANQDSWLTRNKLSVAPWFFLAPALVFFAIYVVIPIFESISLSFYEWNGLYAPDGSSTAVTSGYGSAFGVLKPKRSGLRPIIAAAINLGT